MQVHLTPQSTNRKVGPMPVSTTSDDTCPSTCPLKVKGCYAKGGPLAILWHALSAAKSGQPYSLPRGTAYAHTWSEFCSQIAVLPAGTIWRHNQAGDLPGAGNAIDPIALADLVEANTGRRGFTYTHKPMSSAQNIAAVASANAAGFTINLSANNPTEADTLASLEIGPVVTILPSGTAPSAELATPSGRRITVCPATYRDDTSCLTCQLCQRPNRATIIGFPAHGAAHKTASAIANQQ